MTTITAFALRHRRLIVLGWLVLTVCGALTVSSATSRLTNTFATPGNPGYDANQRIERALGVDAGQNPTIAVLRLPPGQTMKTATGQATAASAFGALAAAPHVAVADYANTHDPTLVSHDGHTTWAVIDMPNPDLASTSGVAARVAGLVKGATPAGATLRLTGFEQLDASSGGGSGPSVLVETLIGVAGALIVLAFVFGSAVAIVPLLTAIPAILTGFLAVLGVTYLTDVNFLVEFLVALLGLGIAVDYSLIVVTRWREERERGLANEAAIIAAGGSAGSAVVFSGLTVAVGLLSLIVLPVPFLRSVGIGGMLVPLISIAAAITLLPVLLSTIGPRLDRLRVRRGSTTSSAFWERFGRLIARRPVIAAALGGAIVLGLAIPALSMNTGPPNTKGMTSNPAAHAALAAIEQGGAPSGIVYPIQLLVHGGSAATDRVAQLARSTPGVSAALAPDSRHFRRGGNSLITVIPAAEGSTSAGQNIVHSLRRRLAGAPGSAEVGGTTAAGIDFNHAVYGNFPLMLTLIALVTFLLLARAFRSVLLAAKAVILNLISLGATYGFLVLFWQRGHGANLFYGVSGTGAIRNFVPVIIFAFLFGLSMDYEVFLLARIREEHDRLRDTKEAVVQGLARTGRLITCASIILAISFLSIGLTPDPVVRMIASGLAFGIVMDVLVMRTLLVPALVVLFGRFNWWMPRPLARALRLSSVS
jgi:RND superfamily putative drug exporter